jgi:hypothetical protein
MGRRVAADRQRSVRDLHEEINERRNDIRQAQLKADMLEEWLGLYEASQPGPVRELATAKLEALLGIQED